MRKIEQEMLQAIQVATNWFKGNTSVISDGAGASVYLHGNHIALIKWNGNLEVNKETLKLYPTNTTISRLRALGADITVRKGCVYLNSEYITLR